MVCGQKVVSKWRPSMCPLQQCYSNCGPGTGAGLLVLFTSSGIHLPAFRPLPWLAMSRGGFFQG